ncbi:hypothetical protein EV356DRAFT_124739 [Viridothelium virens]|uniref:Uncharacterized protein n=1 Tax=Viridothelium virens TaxID=1048519 RepID=A0A6A6HB65_VIRVR|nr:hypothetical protein EV356DRAFT_124739 [Viridothelium virens]
MARANFLIIALAICLVVIRAAPVSNTPLHAHTADIIRERDSLSPIDNKVTLRALLRDFGIRHHRHDRPHYYANIQAPTAWSSEFWMSLATRPSIHCPFRKVDSQHRPHRRPHPKAFGSKHIPEKPCTTYDSDTPANNAKGTFVLLIFAGTAICSLFLAWKVMSVAIDQLRKSFRQRARYERVVEKPSHRLSKMASILEET